MRRRLLVTMVGAGVLLGACSSGSQGQAPTTTSATVPAEETVATAPPTTDPATTSEPSTTTTTSTTVPDTAPTTTTPPTTTTTAAPVPGQPNPACIYTIKPGDSLSAIVMALNNPNVDVGAIATENGLTDVNSITAGEQLDVCPGNGINDRTGGPLTPPTTQPPPPAPPPTPPNTVPPGTPLASGVRAQQNKLNALFANLGMPGLSADGQSGPMTKQQLCAARVALGLPISRNNMAPGSPEEHALMSANSLSTPPTAPVQAGRWALIDQTCEVMFIGQGANHIQFVFQTSTGKSGFETRLQTASRVFWYDPAANNHGWHDSTEFPAAADNPLNGNMYKPLYFSNGEAIHGATVVPTSPASHGCARLHVPDQDRLLAWLGLSGTTTQVWSKSRIGLTVTVQGTY